MRMPSLHCHFDRRSRVLGLCIAALLSASPLVARAQTQSQSSSASGSADAASTMSSASTANLTPSAAGAVPANPTITNNPAKSGPSAGQPAGDRPTATPGQAEQSVRNPSGQGPGRAPTAPNEFQRFVAAATGVTLPIFGETYFTGTPQTFAPLDRVPVPADYVLGPGDELYIRAWGNLDMDWRATIDRNGQVSIPRVGTVNVAGVKASEIEGHLRNQVGRVFKGFSLTVTLGQLRSIQVFVVGQALQPGTYTVGSLSTLINAVFASGGPASNGSMRRVQLKRGSTVITELDLYDFILQGDKSKDARLLPGDVIVYTAAGPRVAVAGAVDTPAIYELKPKGNTVGELIAISGGNRVHANLLRAQLERIDPTALKAPRSVVTVDLQQAKSTPLRDGDVLTVFAVSPQFANAVTLRGNVAASLRYPFTLGMRISDLIPEREALITPDYYLRKNRLVQFVEGRRTGNREGELSVKNLVDEPNWEYATIERLDTDRISTRLIPFNLGKAVLLQDPENNLLLQAGDIVTVFSTRDIRGPQARVNRMVRVEGEVDRPGVYQLQPGETLKALLQRAGGLTPQAYLYGLDFSREETRVRQRENLAAATARLEALAATQSARTAANRVETSNNNGGAFTGAAAAISNTALQAQIARLSRVEPNGRIALELEPTISGLDALPDLPLEDADRISIPARPGFVTVAGAVVNNNAFLWKPGRTAGDYINLAGLDEGAEVSNMFILRADGTVLNANGTRGFFGQRSNLQSQPLYAGDSVVVPSQLDYETWGTALVRGLKDWSQILSNFGLSAAAIKTLRQ